MKKYISLLALAALSLAACNKEQELIPETPAEGNLIITATRDGSTRTAVQPDGKSVWWSAGESIDVFCGPGDTPAVFTGLNTEPAATAKFSGTLDVSSGNKFYAIYPSSSVSCVAANGEMALTLKATQTVAEGTFADGVFPAVAVSDTPTMSFRNVAGGFKFTVGKDKVTEIVFKANGGEPLAGNVNVGLVDGVPEVTYLDSPSSSITVYAPGDGFFKQGVDYYVAALPATLNGGITVTLQRDDAQPLVIESKKALTIKRNVFANIGELSGPKELTIESVWAMFSTDQGAWNEYFGGIPNSDRNIAMDDEYVYVAETPIEPDIVAGKLWAISIKDHTNVKEVNLAGVGGGAKYLGCPRVIKNTDASINGGKDVLVCSNLTRGDGDPVLYMWVNGINKGPKVVTLKTYAESSWYGDVFTVYGTLQEGILFFDKTDTYGNGVVTFNLTGNMQAETLHLLKRIKFNDAFGSHDGACAYYPYPDNPSAGVYSPGRGQEKRGQLATVDGDLFSSGNAAYMPTLTPMEYAEGRNGYILGYNFIEWKGKRYVIYGKQPDASEGFVYVLEGELTDSWENIIDNANVKFRRDLKVTSGDLKSNNSAMDVTARIINGDLYFAAQKQNVACGLYKLSYN